MVSKKTADQVALLINVGYYLLLLPYKMNADELMLETPKNLFLWKLGAAADSFAVGAMALKAAVSILIFSDFGPLEVMTAMLLYSVLVVRIFCQAVDMEIFLHCSMNVGKYSVTLVRAKAQICR
jgi:hypothetical protein